MAGERLLKFPDRDFNKKPILPASIQEVLNLSLVKPLLKESITRGMPGGLDALEYALFSDIKVLSQSDKPLSDVMINSLRMGLDDIRRKKSKHVKLFETAINDLIKFSRN